MGGCAGRAECGKLAYRIGGKRWTGLTAPLLRGVMVARSIRFATLKIILFACVRLSFLPSSKVQGTYEAWEIWEGVTRRNVFLIPKRSPLICV